MLLLVNVAAAAVGAARALAGATSVAAAAGPADRLQTDALEQVLEALPVGVTVTDRDTRTVRFANRAFLELVGRNPDEVLGARALYPGWVATAAGNGSAGTDAAEHEFVRPDGSRVPVTVQSIVLEDGLGDGSATVTVFTDQTERRLFEQQLVQSGKLAAIGELAAGVAHEINNPLFAILGLVEFLLKDVEPGTKAESRLQLVQETGFEIKEIVRALLEFSREPVDELRVVDLRVLTGQVLELLGRASAAKGVEIVEETWPEPLPVRGSPSQLKQVLLNLLTNARQAMGDGGTATVTLAREGRIATVTVTDTGPGVAEDIAGRIFDPFFTTRRDLGGTGLGLSSAAAIAQRHHGSLHLSRGRDGGAAFTLRLPLVAEA